MKVNYITFQDYVKVRKHTVDLKGLNELLRRHKTFTNSQIAEMLDVPVTEVEHWFRKDKYQSIPSADVWWKLKQLLNIQTSDYDKQVCEFITKPAIFEKAQRLYVTDQLSPTITASEMVRVVYESNKNENINTNAELKTKKMRI